MELMRTYWMRAKVRYHLVDIRQDDKGWFHRRALCGINSLRAAAPPTWQEWRTAGLPTPPERERQCRRCHSIAEKSKKELEASA
jgi:hypothetical protein